jgi:hypothetical protein
MAERLSCISCCRPPLRCWPAKTHAFNHSPCHAFPACFLPFLAFFPPEQELELLDLVFYDQHLQREAAAAAGGDAAAAAEDGEGGEGAGAGGAGAAHSKLASLIDIQQEFVAPYGELRKELRPLEVRGQPRPWGRMPCACWLRLCASDALRCQLQCWGCSALLLCR